MISNCNVISNCYHCFRDCSPHLTLKCNINRCDILLVTISDPKWIIKNMTESNIYVPMCQAQTSYLQKGFFSRNNKTPTTERRNIVWPDYTFCTFMVKCMKPAPLWDVSKCVDLEKNKNGDESSWRDSSGTHKQCRPFSLIIIGYSKCVIGMT